MEPLIRRSPLIGLTALFACAGQNATERLAERLTPPPLAVNDEPTTQVHRPMRVRVWVDDDYRAEHVGWRRIVEAQIERANGVIGPRFGAALAVESVSPWQHSGRLAELPASLEALIEHDRGADVDWVVGFTTALPAYTESMQKLGLTRSFSRHIVLRGMSSIAERDAIEKSLADLSTDERERLLQRRLHHKQTVVLLHEWAHTLGAIHVQSDDAFMNPDYHDQSSGFADPNARLIEIGLRHALDERTRDLRPWFAEAREYLDALDFDAWVLSDYVRTKAYIDQWSNKDRAIVRDDALSMSEQDDIDDLLLLAGEGKYIEAYRALQPLAAAEPDAPRITYAMCFIGTHAVETSTTVNTACRRSFEQRPKDPMPMLWIALAAARRVDVAAAGAALAVAEARIADLGRTSYRVQVARVFQHLGRVDDCARAVEPVGDSQMARDLRAWVQTTRARFGLKPSSDGARQGAYVRTLSAAHTQLDAKHGIASHLATISKLGRTNAPATLALRCRIEMNRGRFEDARKLCLRALRGANASYPHYFLGVIESARGDAASARRHLESALALDPDLTGPRTALATIEKRAGPR